MNDLKEMTTLPESESTCSFNAYSSTYLHDLRPIFALRCEIRYPGFKLAYNVCLSDRKKKYNPMSSGQKNNPLKLGIPGKGKR